MSGASGFLGRSLAARLRADGHAVLRLVRRDPAGDDEARWQPARGELDVSLLEGADAVVNLSGAGIFDKRWSASYKRVIRDSRVDSTTTIAKALAAAQARPGVLVNASGIHWYGDTGDHAVDERSPSGAGFMAETVEAWEAATQPAADAGVQVVKLRTAPVLAASGGLLKQMLLPFRLGAGGRLGSGGQYMSWISLADWLSGVIFLMEHGIAGPVNLAAPHPETNEEFTRELARTMRRPAVLPVPRFALQVALGEVTEVALGSLRVLPGVLTRAGYRFQHPELGPALRWALQH